MIIHNGQYIICKNIKFQSHSINFDVGAIEATGSELEEWHMHKHCFCFKGIINDK